MYSFPLMLHITILQFYDMAVSGFTPSSINAAWVPYEREISAIKNFGITLPGIETATSHTYKG